MSHQIVQQIKLTDLVELVEDSGISSIKNIVSGIISIINDPKSTVKDLNKIIQVDPPLTSRVLRLANSSYYSPPNKISEIIRAVIWVGYDEIKELALNQKVCQIFKKDESLVGYSRKALWKHSLAVALLGKMIYRREYGERGENMYAAGLLHDIGLIVVDQFCQDEFKDVLRRSKSEEENVARTEFKVLGFDHTELAKAIMKSWNIPKELCTAIGNHHNPAGVDQVFSKMVNTLYVADHFCQEKGVGYGDAPFSDKAVFQNCMRSLKLDSRVLDLIMEDVKEEILKMEDEGFFN